TRMGLVWAIGNAVPARAGYVVALPLLIAALEQGVEAAEDNSDHDESSMAMEENLNPKMERNRK
ncbi:MAG: hypothetical protein IKU71_06765, partial [Kiritimatiellae bacterium]|nr:hypothetical protein [Kiritimatiellia bacterium]